MTGHRILAACALLAITTAPAVSAQETPLELTAWAVNMSNVGTGRESIVQITIERWSTPEERQALHDTLVEQGSEALLRKLQDMKPVGTIRTPESLGYDLRYAAEAPQAGGGRRIVLATDRPIGWWEAREQPRSIQYPFTVLEIRMPEDGKGIGKLTYAAKITYDRGAKTIVLENYASEPIRLQNVEARR